MTGARNVWQGIRKGLSRSQRGLIILQEDGETVYTPQELVEASERAACSLVRLGVEPGDRVGIMAQTTPETVVSFLGCWAAGAVAVPLPLPMRAVEPHAFIEQCRRRLHMVEARLLALPGSLLPMVGETGVGMKLVACEDLSAGGGMPAVPNTPEDIAMVQFTSGSTSEPRGVVLTHANIMANVRAISRKVKVTHRDRIVSWMPLYHDMGLIGFLITALGSGASLVLMSPQRFVSDPSLWMRAISDHRATITGGPNFAYALSARVLASGAAGDLDLSSLRLALNGAEPVDPEVLDGFVEAGRPYGLRRQVPYPVYGLAEATLAVTFPHPGKAYRLDYVSRAGIEEERYARPAEPDGEGTRALASLGSALEGLELSILRVDGSEADEREVYEL